MTRLLTCLWFDGDVEEAAEFYASLLPDSHVDRCGARPPTPLRPRRKVLTVDLTISGHKVQLLNGGPHFTLSEAVSLSIDCADQAEVDRLWDALAADGGEPGPCGWVKDRFGLSWQVVPRRLEELLDDPDPDRARRAMEAMLEMGKIDVAELERAADAG